MNDEERQGRSKRRDKTPKRSPSKIGSISKIIAPPSPQEKDWAQTTKTPGKSTAKKPKSPDNSASK